MLYEVITNSAFGDTGSYTYGEVAFSNLNPAVAYSFTFYASRTGVSDIRDARYTATGATGGSAVLDAANNTSNVVTVADIYPTTNGVITAGIRNNFV